METLRNSGSSYITVGADARAEKEKRKKVILPVNQDKPVGYCGICRERYEGNFTQHECLNK